MPPSLSTFFGKPVAHKFEASDAALVLAIFPGTPYVVVTDGGKAANAPPGGQRSLQPAVPWSWSDSGPSRIKRRRPRVRRRRPPPDFSDGLVLGQQTDFQAFVRRRTTPRLVTCLRKNNPILRRLMFRPIPEY